MKISENTKKLTKFNCKRGFGLIEIIVMIFIIIVALASLAEFYVFYIKASTQNEKYIQAVSLAQEELEAVRSIKNGSWNDISAATIGNNYYLVQSGSPLKWSLAAGQESISGFTRSIVFSRIFRDANDNIIDAGGTEDAESRKVTASISWSDRGRSFSTSLILILSNWH